MRMTDGPTPETMTMAMTDDNLVLTVKLGLGAFAVVLLTCFVLYDRHIGTVARDMLAQWARKYGYQFVSLERKWLRLGPFGWVGSRRAIFRGVVLTLEGKRRAGYFRVGTPDGEIGNYRRCIWDPDRNEISDEMLDEQIDIIWDR